ncbi:MAG: phosphate acyltransferase PlsX, partial [Verrucomicrobia bacterium]|nr:phosphate acyltransferase PlsX [Verrucomicrobiota bacterium]
FDLFEDPADVVVCDGFTGNVVLKTAEAAAQAIFGSLRNQIYKSFWRKLGAKLAEGAFRTIRARMNPDEYGGSQLLGVNGICIIAHGASSPLAIKNAIGAAANAIKYEVNPRIARDIMEQAPVKTAS